MADSSFGLQSTEMEFESLLLRIVPGLARAWQGATRDEIERIERIAGRSLPGFYRWFLSRMGRKTGPVAYPSYDFSAARVLSCYAEGLVAPDSRYLLIGYELNESEPMHLFYDLETSVRNDALVVLKSFEDDVISSRFETFREMLARGNLFLYRVERMAQRCRGVFFDESSMLFPRLDSIMASLGFVKPIPTGARCGLHERGDAVLVYFAAPSNEPLTAQGFSLGAADVGTIKRILGAISQESSLEISVTEWRPPLQG